MLEGNLEKETKKFILNIYLLFGAWSNKIIHIFYYAQCHYLKIYQHKILDFQNGYWYMVHFSRITKNKECFNTICIYLWLDIFTISMSLEEDQVYKDWDENSQQTKRKQLLPEEETS